MPGEREQIGRMLPPMKSACGLPVCYHEMYGIIGRQVPSFGRRSEVGFNRTLIDR